MKQSNHENVHGLSSEQFMEEVTSRISTITSAEQHISLIALDFDNFNYVNDLYGYEVGDIALAQIMHHFDAVLNSGDIYCKLHADHFLVCLRTSDLSAASQTFLELTDLKQVLSDILPPHHALAASGGILTAKDSSVSLTALLDQANCARKLSKGVAGNTFRIYDEKMNEDIQWKKQVTCMMEVALGGSEFEMYLQPKVFFSTGEIVGAEALVRWNSPQFGLIYPDQFIPILEQNGFICQLDFFILREACHFLAENRRLGQPILPISVNFSKSHLRTEKLVERIFQTVNSFGVSTSLIEIEFTENLLSENTEQLIGIVSDLKLLGFRVALDDFGSAYSSLSYLKDLPIDIVKIDKGFLDSSADSDRGKIIVAKMVELIKSLRMLSVMEGVETGDQVDFLQKLSCDIAQGYYYAKPMPKANYLEYLNNGSVMQDIEEQLSQASNEQPSKSYLNIVPQEFQMDNWELYTLGKNIDMGLMKGYLDGEATVQYVNDRALEYLGYNRKEFREIFQNSIVAFTHPDDAETVQKNAEHLVKTGEPLDFTARAFRKDGKVITLKGRSSCVIDNQGRPVGIYAFQDVTEELEHTAALQGKLEDKIRELEQTIVSEQQAKESLRQREEQYRIIAEQGDNITFEWDFAADTIAFSGKYQLLFGYAPIQSNISTNEGVRNRIHPEDLDIFEKWVSNTYQKPGYSEATFRILVEGDTYLLTSCRSTAICDNTGKPLRTVGVFTDVQAQKQLMDELERRAQLDSLTKLLNKEECQKRIDTYLQDNPQENGALFMIDADNFKDINDNLGHQLGDSVLKDMAARIQQSFPETTLIGRIGGDEFVVYLPNTGEQEALSKAESLSRLLRLSYFGSVTKYEMSGSIGIARRPHNGDTFDELYRYADIALHSAKQTGKNHYIMYREDIEGNFLDNRTPIEYSQNFLNSYFKNDITFQVFRILYATKDTSASIQEILELLGKYFGVDRTYIFKITEDQKHLRNTFEWCSSGITPQIENLQNLPISALGSYFEQYSQEGILCCENALNSTPEIASVCAPQGIKSLLHCAIYDEGEIIGFIGFDHCEVHHSWTGDEIAILGYTSRILSVFTAKDTAIRLQKRT